MAEGRLHIYRSLYVNVLYKEQEKTYVRCYTGSTLASPHADHTEAPSSPGGLSDATPAMLQASRSSSLSPETVACLRTPAAVRSSAGVGVTLPRFVLALRLEALHQQRLRHAVNTAAKRLHYDLLGIRGIGDEDDDAVSDEDNSIAVDDVVVSSVSAGAREADTAHTNAVFASLASVLGNR
jgi:hypothetical protein